jgi:hypothetical protein
LSERLRGCVAMDGRGSREDSSATFHAERHAFSRPDLLCRSTAPLRRLRQMFHVDKTSALNFGNLQMIRGWFWFRAARHLFSVADDFRLQVHLFAWLMLHNRTAPLCCRGRAI